MSQLWMSQLQVSRVRISQLQMSQPPELALVPAANFNVFQPPKFSPFDELGLPALPTPPPSAMVGRAPWAVSSTKVQSA